MGQPAYDYSDYDLPPEEDVAADVAAEQTSHLTVIEGGQGAAGADAAAGADTAAAGGADAAAAGGADVAGAEAPGTAAGLGTVLAGVAAGITVFLWDEDTAGPEWPTPRAGPPTANAPKPNPKPVTICPLPPPDACIKLVQDVRGAIDRNKRDYGGKGMHGVNRRWEEMINGKCGPGQFPYWYNWGGDYVKMDVWENHVKEFEATQRALWNRFAKAVDAGCEGSMSKDLLDDAEFARQRKAPDPSEWKGDPNEKCTDDTPPPNWGGPWEPESSRGL